MNRINKLFQQKSNNILNIYNTAGFPTLNSTRTIIQQLDEAGVDLIELGMPYSDPLADGPTIQRSSEIALKNGMSIKVLFEQLEGLRVTTQIPIVLMGYLNPVMQYGVEAFLKDCQRLGVDGLILPDLPIQEYQENYKSLFKKYGISMIFLITPQTSEERIRLIDSLSDAFIYVVSSASTTGNQAGFDTSTEAYFKRIKNLNLKNPTLIGFGVSDKTTYETVCQYANGAIIGSAFIRMLENGGSVGEFVHNLK